MEIDGDVIFSFEKIQDGYHIIFTLDLLIKSVNPIITLDPKVVNPPTFPVLNINDRVIITFEGVRNGSETRFTYIGGTLSGGGSSPPFVDTDPLIKGSGDDTKLLRFEIDGFSSGVTRVMTPPNADILLAGLNIAQTWTALNTFNGITMTDDFNLNTHDAINIDRLRFTPDSGAVASAGDSSILLDGSSNMIFNIADQKQWFWNNQNQPIMQLNRQGVNNDTVLTVETDSSHASAVPIIDIFRDDPSPAVNDEFGKLRFSGTDSALNSHVFSQISVDYESVTVGRIASRMIFATSFDTGAATQLKPFMVINSGNDERIRMIEDLEIAKDIILQDGSGTSKLFFDGGSDTYLTGSAVSGEMQFFSDASHKVSMGSIGMAFFTDYFLQMAERASDPAAGTGTTTGKFYVKTVAGVAKPFFIGDGQVAVDLSVSGSASPLTTKGDLFGFDAVDARIPIGGNGEVLTADTGQVLGLKWSSSNLFSINATENKSQNLRPASGAAQLGASSNRWAVAFIGFLDVLTDSQLRGSVFLGSSSSNFIHMTGTVATNINMGNNAITSLSPPTADLDAANKKYVDDNSASIWATFPAIADVDHATFDSKNIDRLLFDKSIGSALSGSDVGITSNPSNDMLFNVAAGGDYRFKVQTSSDLFSINATENKSQTLIPTTSFETLGDSGERWENLFTNNVNVKTSALFSGEVFLGDAPSDEINMTGTVITDIRMSGANRAIRAATSTEIGLFVTNTSASVGSQGTLQMPSIPVSVTNFDALNSLFGSAAGNHGVYTHPSLGIQFAIKATSTKWVVLTLPDSGGTVTSTHFT